PLQDPALKKKYPFESVVPRFFSYSRRGTTDSKGYFFLRAGSCKGSSRGGRGGSLRGVGGLGSSPAWAAYTRPTVAKMAPPARLYRSRRVMTAPGKRCRCPASHGSIIAAHDRA